MKRNWFTDALEMKASGYTYAAIAEKFGVTRQRVAQRLSPRPEVRKFVVDRDRGKCQKCGKVVGESGHVHHVVYEDISPDRYCLAENMTLLCVSCHRMAHVAQYEAKPPKAKQVKVTKFWCFRCRKWWAPKVKPKRCGNCKSPYWDKEKKK